jgi:ketosteroid isomerase-like protein
LDQSAEKIKEVAMQFDVAIENRDIELMVSAFADDCEIELLGVVLKGKDGVRKWLEWLFMHLVDVKLIPVIIMVEGDVFFEEFVVRGTLHDGTVIESKQAEVLIYENYKIKSLRLYFDRLDFIDAVVDGFISKRIVRTLIKRSLEGLV